MKNIDIKNKDNLKLFVSDNIERINKNINDFSQKKLKKISNEKFFYTQTEIETYLAIQYKAYLDNEINRNSLYCEFDKISEKYKKNIDKALDDIANRLYLNKNDIHDCYTDYIYSKFRASLRTNNYINEVMEIIINLTKNISDLTDTNERYIKNSLKKQLQDYLYLCFQKGFVKSVLVSDTGVRIANEGDSAQFLFIARAMLAGFNCSNVDLRSSRYDAIIDIDNKLLRVQIKGISNDNSACFKDRDRGGNGIDPKNSRNKGKAISSEDCDIYVCIKKETGICYIIPAKKIDEFVSKGKFRKSLNELEEYKENWNIISEVKCAIFGDD